MLKIHTSSKIHQKEVKGKQLVQVGTRYCGVPGGGGVVVWVLRTLRGPWVPWKDIGSVVVGNSLGSLGYRAPTSCLS